MHLERLVDDRPSAQGFRAAAHVIVAVGRHHHNHRRGHKPANIRKKGQVLPIRQLVVQDGDIEAGRSIGNRRQGIRRILRFNNGVSAPAQPLVQRPANQRLVVDDQHEEA